MMFFSQNPKLNYPFTILITSIVLGFGLYSFFSYKILSELKVNGPIYQQIIQGKDLVADVLPPPEYIIESYLVSLQLLTHDKAAHEDLIKRLALLQQEFETRHSYWARQNLPGELASDLLSKSYQPASTFYHIAFTEFIPAIKQADSTGSHVAIQKMQLAYEQHRNVLDDVIRIANQQVLKDESAANLKIATSNKFLLGLLILILGVFGGFIAKISLLLHRQMHYLASQTLQLNTLLHTVPSAILTINRTGNIITFNRAAEQIFGYQAKEIITSLVSTLLEAAIGEEFEHFLTIHNTNSGNGLELVAKRKDGSQFPVLLRVNSMSIKGEIFYCAVIDDISETKTLQAQLYQAQKLEAIGQLASGIAHEINTPIQYIGDNLSALFDNINDIQAFSTALHHALNAEANTILETLESQYDLAYILEDSPKAIQQAQNGIERVTEIIKAMKAFSHIDASSHNLQTANIVELINNALIISRNSFKHCAEIATDYSPDVSLIECYPNELNQVFLNLIVNATHAIEEKQAGVGLIKISTRKLKESVEILIQDNGTGIPLAIQDKVFNLFFTTKEVGKGTGQGLSLSHSIVVERHHGKLFFESTVGIGTTFHIQLPIQANRQESQSET